ncbi:unnamed protein product [Brassicogethes aeneus]|uniref:Citrate transporter-like domain-containing protein n=1 Tax=Brassicogethes aeneus TaxID=1431903 RepID=A0A9P0FCX4_BRAAE|nr:unnamed protein product [Brassicogethes aeneus]
MDSENLRKTVLLKENAKDNQCGIKINLELPDTISTITLRNSLDLDDKSNELFQIEDNAQEEINNNDWKICAKHFKLFILISLWLVCSSSLMVNNVKVQDMHQISVPKESTESYVILKKPKDNKVTVMLAGALLPPYYGNLSKHWMTVYIQLIVLNKMPIDKDRSIEESNIILLQNVSKIWHVPLVTENLIGVVPEVKLKNVFKLSPHQIENTTVNLLQIQFSTNLQTNFPVSVGYNLHPINTDDGIIYAALVLVGLYILIIFDIIHRTLAAMLASTISLAILAAMSARPTMSEIVSWIDIETIMLLFSMMTLVTIFSETGVFDYMAVKAFEFTGGKVWPLINVICIITTIFSSLLDNVTTALLVTPVTIKLCEVMKLNPVPILMYTIIFDNIGGSLTPIGDPPNVILASNAAVKASGVNFGVFTMHMGAGVILSLVVVYIQLRYIYSNPSNFKYSLPIEVEELKREIAVWQRTAASVASYSKDEEAVKESLIKKSEKLKGLLQHTMHNTSALSDIYRNNLETLKIKYPIKDKMLLIKSGGTLCLVIFVFFLHSIPAFSKLGLGWTSLLGALLLLLLYDKDDIESIFNRVEWATLLFFSSLFILMEALSQLGLIDWIGKQTQAIIMSVSPDSRLTVAIILMLWVSGLASAFVDNLPLTTMMVRIATDLSDNRELNLPLQPLIWALAFGACFGGNGTLFGSSSNIVCAGIAEQHGYRFSFLEFMKVGVPVMFLSLSVVTVYLLICHVVFEWH